VIAEALRGLRYGRVWLAALAASLLAFGLLIPLGMVTQRVLPAFMPAAMLEWWLNLAPLLRTAVVEGCKLAVLWWLLGRNTGQWFALGIAYGTLAACWDLWQLVGNAIRFPRFFAPSIGWVVPLAAAILLHGTLGLLAQGLARGRVWWGWAGASVMGFTLLAWRSFVMQVVPLRLPDWLDERGISWLGFGIAAWAMYRHGPRHLVVLCLGVVCALALVLGVLHQAVPVAGVQRSDPVAVAVVVLGIGFLAAMVAQRSVLPWMRGTPQA
jgi:hypothetical protein